MDEHTVDRRSRRHLGRDGSRSGHDAPLWTFNRQSRYPSVSNSLPVRRRRAEVSNRAPAATHRLTPESPAESVLQLPTHTICIVRRDLREKSESAPGWNRTSDPLLRRQVLYPLSYEGLDEKVAHLPWVSASGKLTTRACRPGRSDSDENTAHRNVGRWRTASACRMNFHRADAVELRVV
jgi:hypothetical protein